MKNKSLEQIFQEKLGKIKIEPSERATQIFNKKINKRRRIIVFRRLSVAASVLLIGMVTVLYLYTGSDNDPMVRENIDVEKIQKTEITAESNTLTPDDPTEVKRSSVQNELQKQVLALDNKNLTTTIQDSNKSNSNEILQAVDSEQKLDADKNRVGDINKSMELLSTINKESISHSTADSAILDTGITEERKPQKITIEYIASGSNRMDTVKHKSRFREFYVKMNELEYPEEVLGDVRSFKDQLFTLDFIKGNKSETKNRK